MMMISLEGTPGCGCVSRFMWIFIFESLGLLYGWSVCAPG